MCGTEERDQFEKFQLEKSPIIYNEGAALVRLLLKEKKTKPSV